MSTSASGVGTSAGNSVPMGSHRPRAKASSDIRARPTSEATTAAADSGSPKTGTSLTVPAVRSLASETPPTLQNTSMANASNLAVSNAAGARTIYDFSTHVSAPNGGVSTLGGGYGSLALAPHRRKLPDGTTAMTLYVRGKDGSDAGGHDVSVYSRDNGAGSPTSRRRGKRSKGNDTGKNPAPENRPLALVEDAVSTLSATSEKVVGGIPGVARRFTSPVLTAAGIFIFFLLVDLYCLNSSRATVQGVLDSCTIINDQLLSVSASLAERHAEKQEHADAIAEPYLHTPRSEIARAYREADHLRRARDRSVQTLHRHIAYPDPVEDIQFLVDEHVGYEVRIRKLVESELEWMQVANNAMHARTASHRHAHVVIGHNADAHLGSLADEVRKRVQYMTYPLREDTGTDSSGSGSSKPTNDGNEGGDGDGGEKKAACVTPGCKVPKHRPARTNSNTTSERLAQHTSKTNARRRREDKGFDAYVESKGSPSRRHKLEEIGINVPGHDEDSRKLTESIVKRLLRSRLFVFIAICTLMFVFFHVS